MPTTSTPTWSAVRNGLTGDPGATLNATGINQLLGTHLSGEIYTGTSVVTPDGHTNSTAVMNQLSTQDVDQPFTMSGTVIGRVDVPVVAIGEGADLLVSLHLDNSGVPGALVNQTRIPASWITQLSAVTGVSAPATTPPTLIPTGNPLATGQFNTYRGNTYVANSYAYPAISASGVAASSIGAYYDTGGGTCYLYLIGGTVSGATLNNVFSVSGDSVGNVNAPLPQPTFPQNADGSGKATVCVEPSGGTTSLIVVGGATTFGGVPTGVVYISTIDPVTGNLGAWSLQTALPVNIQNQSMISYNGYVYVLGGTAEASTGPLYNTVYYAQVQNAQITTWNQTTPYPVPLTLSYLAVIGNKLICVGGDSAVIFTPSSYVYYSTINSNGTLGPWIPGPQLPVTAINANGASPSNDFGVIIPGGSTSTCTLGFTEAGPGLYWSTTATEYGTPSLFYAASSGGTAQELCSINYAAESSVVVNFSLTPTISVPLPTTGLSNGATYHVTLQQLGGDLGNYLSLWDNVNVFSGDPTLLLSPRGTNTWTAGTSTHAIPIQIFDQSVVGQILHTWEDSGARISTIVRATTPDYSILGLCESVTQPGPPLNQVWNFEETLGQWNATGGTLTQSSLYAYRQLTESARVVPNGSSAQVYLQSGDYVPVILGHTYTATAVFYTPVGYSQCLVNINWYASNHTYLSTTAGTVTAVAASTGTVLTVSAQPPTTPTSAAYAWVTVEETGTPPTSAVFHTFIGALTDNLGNTFDNVAQVTYEGVWPNLIGPPTTITQLA